MRRMDRSEEATKGDIKTVCRGVGSGAGVRHYLTRPAAAVALLEPPRPSSNHRLPGNDLDEPVNLRAPQSRVRSVLTSGVAR
jgi:hypothetical protein